MSKTSLDRQLIVAMCLSCGQTTFPDSLWKTSMGTIDFWRLQFALSHGVISAPPPPSAALNF